MGLLSKLCGIADRVYSVLKRNEKYTQVEYPAPKQISIDASQTSSSATKTPPVSSFISHHILPINYKRSDIEDLMSPIEKLSPDQKTRLKGLKKELNETNNSYFNDPVKHQMSLTSLTLEEINERGIMDFVKRRAQGMISSKTYYNIFDKISNKYNPEATDYKNRKYVQEAYLERLGYTPKDLETTKKGAVPRTVIVSKTIRFPPRQDYIQLGIEDLKNMRITELVKLRYDGKISEAQYNYYKNFVSTQALERLSKYKPSEKTQESLEAITKRMRSDTWFEQQYAFLVPPDAPSKVANALHRISDS